MATLTFTAQYPATDAEVLEFALLTGYQQRTVVNGELVDNPISAIDYVSDNVAKVIATYLHQFTRAEIERQKQAEKETAIEESFNLITESLTITVK